MPESSPPTTVAPPSRVAIGRWLTLVATLVFLVAGTARLAPQARLALHADELRAASGVVTRSDVLEHGGRDYVTARVTLEYSVDGRAYVLQASGRDGQSAPASSAEAFAMRHPVGARMAVFYLPDSPQISALTRAPDIAADLGFLGFLAVVAVSLAWSLFRRRRRFKNEVQNAPGDAPR